MNSGNENRNSEFPLKPILVGGLILLIWQTVQAITTMITVFFSAMLTIAIIGASLVAAYLVFSFIRDRELGQNKKIRKIAKIQREMNQTLPSIPKDMRDEYKQSCLKRQRQVFEERSSSRFADILDGTKQVVSTFKGGRNGNKDSHR